MKALFVKFGYLDIGNQHDPTKWISTSGSLIQCIHHSLFLRPSFVPDFGGGFKILAYGNAS